MATQMQSAQPTRALAPAAAKRDTLRTFFEKQRPELSMVLPKGVSLDRMIRIALTACLKDPKLLDCTQQSWALAMQTCCAQGLYPDSALGEMYLIARNNSKKRPDGTWEKVMEVTAQRGYQGDIALARRSGEIADIYAEVVYEKDHYKVRKGLDRGIEHEPYDGDDDPGPLKAAYAVAKMRSGEVAFVTLSRRDVMRHKARSEGADRDSSPWVRDEAAMWRKSAIRELFKWLPRATDAMAQVASQILQPDVIDTSAVDLGPAQLAEAAPTSPDPLLEAAGITPEPGTLPAQPTAEPTEPAGPACDHTALASRTVAPEAAPCTVCGELVAGTAREPGDDSDDLFGAPPAAARATMKGRRG